MVAMETHGGNGKHFYLFIYLFIFIDDYCFFLFRLTQAEFSQLTGNLEEIFAFQQKFLSSLEEVNK